jgi:hypothetical protein
MLRGADILERDRDRVCSVRLDRLIDGGSGSAAHKIG